MDDAELKRLEALCVKATMPTRCIPCGKPLHDDEGSDGCAGMPTTLIAVEDAIEDAGRALPAALAEIRRLRGLVKDAEWTGEDGGLHCCPWCFATVASGLGHDASTGHCPAFTPDGKVR